MEEQILEAKKELVKYAIDASMDHFKIKTTAVILIILVLSLVLIYLISLLRSIESERECVKKRLKGLVRITRGDGDDVWVHWLLASKIMEFQKEVKDWKELEKLLIAGDRETRPLGKVLYNWVDFVEKHPQFKEAIGRLGGNCFNTVMEFDALNEKGELIRCSALFAIETYENTGGRVWDAKMNEYWVRKGKEE